MKTLTFHNGDISKGPLILVNPLHPLDSDLCQEQLVSVQPGASNILLERQAATMLSEVITLLKCGQKIVPVSGYRAMREQQSIYECSLRENGQEFTQKYVAIPGCSEHQTGLAIDLAKNTKPIDFIRPDFPYTGIYGQFRALSVQHGFIERYPAGREAITQIAHEPWHFRYVGYPHSKIIREHDFTLEEYIEYLKQFPYRDRHFHFNHKEHSFEIFYVPVSKHGEVSIEVPDDSLYQVSGNNADGVVVTLWGRQQG